MLDSWLTPQDQVFSVQHYGVPEFDYNNYRLEIGGMVKQPKQFTVDDLKALPKTEVVMTLECAGNGSNPGFKNAVCNNRWGGTALAPLLKECGIDTAVTEVVFFGEDKQEEILRPGTKRELNVEVPFGRSMSLGDATRPDVLLAYERNGQPIEHRNGADPFDRAGLVRRRKRKMVDTHRVSGSSLHGQIHGTRLCHCAR